MYKINLPALRQVKQEYAVAAETLKTEKENIQNALLQITDDVWCGEDAEAMKNTYEEYLSGSYATLVEKVDKVVGILAEALSTAESLKEYCEQLAIPLHGAAIFLPSVIAEHEGELVYNADTKYAIALGREAVCTNAKIIAGLAGIVDMELSGLSTIRFDSHAYTDAIRTSCQRIGYLEDFEAALSNYGDNVELLNYNLKQALQVHEEGTLTDVGYRYETERKSLEVTIAKIKYLMLFPTDKISEAEYAEYVAALEQLFQAEDIETIQNLADVILKKDESMWTQQEALFLAEVWTYCLESRNDDMAEFWLSQMCDVERCQVVLAQIDPFEHGESYYTLNRVCQYVAVRESESDIPVVFTVNAELTQKEPIIQITSDTEKWFDEKSIRFTVMDLNEELGQEGLETLRNLGFSEEQIVILLSLPHTDEDIDFSIALYQADMADEYKKVFYTNPQELSDFGSYALFQYSYLLMDNNLECDAEGRVISSDFTALQEFLNGMLGSQYKEWVKVEVPKEEEYVGNLRREEMEWQMVSYTGDYLGLLVVENEAMKKLIETSVYVNYTDMARIATLEESFYKQANLCALYKALDYYVYEMRETEYYCRINNLELSDLVGNTKDELLSHTSFSWGMDVLPHGITIGASSMTDIQLMRLLPPDYDQEIKEINYLKEKKESTLASLTWRGEILCTLAGYIPGIGTGIGVALDILGTEDSLLACLQEYEDVAQAEEEMLADVLLDGVILQKNGESMILDSGTYNMETLVKRSYLYQEGLSFMVDEETESVVLGNIEMLGRDTIIGDDAKLLGTEDVTLQKDMLSVVWCGEPLREDSTMKIADLTPSQIRTCIKILGSADLLTETNIDSDYAYVYWYEKLQTYDVMEENVDEK